MIGLAWTIARESAAQNRILPATAASHKWRGSGKIGLGNPRMQDSYVIAWGQVFMAVGATINPALRVTVRNMELYLLSRSTGEWSRVQQQDRLTGGQYDSAFTEAAEPLTMYSNPPDPLVCNMVSGRFFHFFPTWQYLMPDPEDVGGLIASFEAKINLASEIGNVIGSVGTDYRVDPASDPEGDAFIGSFKALTTEFRKFYGSNLRLAELTAFPPPDALQQIT